MRSEKTAEPKMLRKGSGRSSSPGQSFLLFLLVIAAGYNTYSNIQLRAEIADLQGKHHSGNTTLPDSSAASGDATSSSLFEQARKEIAHAQAKLHIKDYDKARADLQQGVASLERANAQTRAEGEKVLAQLRTAAQSLQDKTISPAKTGRGASGSAPGDDTDKADSSRQ